MQGKNEKTNETNENLYFIQRQNVVIYTSIVRNFSLVAIIFPSFYIEILSVFVHTFVTPLPKYVQNIRNNDKGQQQQKIINKKIYNLLMMAIILLLIFNPFGL